MSIPEMQMPYTLYWCVIFDTADLVTIEPFL